MVVPWRILRGIWVKPQGLKHRQSPNRAESRCTRHLGTGDDENSLDISGKQREVFPARISSYLDAEQTVRGIIEMSHGCGI